MTRTMKIVALLLALVSVIALSATAEARLSREAEINLAQARQYVLENVPSGQPHTAVIARNVEVTLTVIQTVRVEPRPCRDFRERIVTVRYRRNVKEVASVELDRTVRACRSPYGVWQIQESGQFQSQYVAQQPLRGTRRIAGTQFVCRDSFHGSTTRTWQSMRPSRVIGGVQRRSGNDQVSFLVGNLLDSMIPAVRKRARNSTRCSSGAYRVSNSPGGFFNYK